MDALPPIPVRVTRTRAQIPVENARLRFEPKPAARISSLQGGLKELCLEGVLPGGWLRRVTAGCAQRGISVTRGVATFGPDESCLACLELEFRRPSVDPPDFLAWAVGRIDPPAAPLPKILDFDLVHDSVPTKGVFLEVHAWESVGLLAGVLEAVEAVGLVPVELFLETEEECAFHQLVLSRSDGGPASTARLLRLNRLLRPAISAG